MSSIQTLPIAAAVLSQIIQGGSSGLGSTMPLQPQEGPPPAGMQNQFTPGDQMVQHAAMAVPGVPGYMQGGRAEGQGGGVRGAGDGMSDDVPAMIDGQEPARIANDEFIIPGDVVSDLGNGSSDAGHKRLYNMMDNIRKARHGTTKQPPQVKQGLASLMRSK